MEFLETPFIRTRQNLGTNWGIGPICQGPKLMKKVETRNPFST